MCEYIDKRAFPPPTCMYPNPNQTGVAGLRTLFPQATHMETRLAWAREKGAATASPLSRQACVRSRGTSMAVPTEFHPVRSTNEYCSTGTTLSKSSQTTAGTCRRATFLHPAMCASLLGLCPHGGRTRVGRGKIRRRRLPCSRVVAVFS